MKYKNPFYCKSEYFPHIIKNIELNCYVCFFVYSEDHFQQLFDNMKTGDSTLAGNPILVNFKSKLLTKVKNDFKDFWRDYQVDWTLALLRDTQSLTKPDAPQEAWRPTAKTPLEQTRYLRVFILRNKIALLQKQIPHQKHSLNVSFFNLVLRIH